MMEFLHMDGYAAYVWSSYAVTLGALALNILWARRSLARARHEALRRLTASQEHKP
jgi:heme exporter protein CcmD